MRMLCSRSASLMTSTRMSRLIATIILRIVSASALSPYLHLVELGDAVDELGDLVAEVAAHLVERVRRVLDRVVEQRGDQGRLGHAELGEDRRDRERVGDVGLAALALLAAVHPLGGDVGPLEQREVGLGVVGPDRAEQRLEDRVAGWPLVPIRASRARIRPADDAADELRLRLGLRLGA